MLETKYNELVKKIDKNLPFEFTYVDYKEENNVFTGKKVIPFNTKGKAIKRNEQFIIDENGISHSLLKDKLIVLGEKIN